MLYLAERGNYDVGVVEEEEVDTTAHGHALLAKVIVELGLGSSTVFSLSVPRHFLEGARERG